jgi:RNA polymerase sigma factor (sigma-70 family)
MQTTIAITLCLGFTLWASFVLRMLRRQARELDGWGLASMSSGLEGEGGGPPGGGRPPIEEIRSRIASPWMQAKIRHWLYHLTIPKQDREEVAQEVTLQALRSAHTYDPAKASLERWINRITVNVAADWHERARRGREEPPGELQEQEEDAPQPDKALEATQDLQSLLEALRFVPLDLRAIVVAHDLDGEAMQEIAERYRLPLSTAYKWRARGLAALSDALHKLRG